MEARTNKPNRPVDLVLNQLEAAGKHGTRDAEGWCFPCPAHEDTQESLSVNANAEGDALVRCHDGCPTEVVIKALGLSMRDLFAQPTASNYFGPFAATYDYLDEAGKLLYQVCRTADKQFPVRRPDPSQPGQWLWGLSEASEVLYRLPQVLAAAPHGETVYVVEGEKDVEALEKHGVIATCNPGGAGKWTRDYSTLLSGATVVVVADRDEVGEAHASEVARSLFAEGVPVRVVVAKDGKDAADHLRAGYGVDEFEPADDLAAPGDGLGTLTVDDILAARPQMTRKELLEENPDLASLLGINRKDADLIVALVDDKEWLLMHDPEGSAYAGIGRDGHEETLAIRSTAFALLVREHFYRRYGRTPGKQSLEDALAVIEARAIFDGGEVPVWLRVGHLGDCVYLDLGDPAWRVVEVSPNGWRLLPDSPVRFRRTAQTAALPVPVAGELSQLRDFINLHSDGDFYLLSAWLLGCLQPPQRPIPLLALHGEQGSAKSTTARLLRSLIDPNVVPLRAGPSEQRDLMIAAEKNWVLAYDNLSKIPDWLSDALCRLATGGGFATRQLYSDREEIVFSAQRPVILNGIEELTTRSDLLDRTLLVSLPRIPEDKRCSEKELHQAFEQVRPQILGGLLDGVAAGLRHLESTELLNKPRMTDFATFATAAEPGIHIPRGAFLRAYAGNRAVAHETAIDAASIGPTLLAVAREQFAGTATDLLTRLNELADDHARSGRDWPRNGRQLSGQVRRLAPDLRALGCDIDYVREPGTGKRLILLSPVTTATKVTDDIAAHADGDEGDGRDANLNRSNDEDDADV